MRRLTVPLLLLLFLTACIPFLNSLAGDRDASLSYAVNGITFDSGSRTAVGVNLSIRGGTLRTTDERCEVLVSGALTCPLGNITGSTTVVLSGTNVHATATWKRGASQRLYHFALRD